MTLYLKWKSPDNKVFVLGELTKKRTNFYFKYYVPGLKAAIQKGCTGVAGFDLGKDKIDNEYKSKTLFPFFKGRIINKDDPNITNILTKYGLDTYDEMKILKITRGKLGIDNYFVEE